MNMLDSTLDFFLRAFKVRSKQLQRDQALTAAANFPDWFAVELNYKGTPIRLIIAAESVPADFKLAQPKARTDQLPASVVGP